MTHTHTQGYEGHVSQTLSLNDRPSNNLKGNVLQKT